MAGLNVKRQKELKPENIEKIVASKKISQEEAVFGLMRDVPALFGAMSDWDDISNISIAVIGQLKHFMSYEDCYKLVLRVVTLYDVNVVTIVRSFSDVRRLAYFVNEMIESMLEVPEYAAYIQKEVAEKFNTNDHTLSRGVVLRKITREAVQTLLVNDKERFFKAELMRTANESPLRSQLWG